jgi:hypothetical protein
MATSKVPQSSFGVEAIKARLAAFKVEGESRLARRNVLYAVW